MKPFACILLTMVIISGTHLFAGIGNPAQRGNADNASYLDRIPAGTQFIPHTVIVKFKQQHKSSLSKNAVNIPSLSPAFLKYGVLRTIQMYPDAAPTITANGEIDISRMYRIEFSADENPLDVAKYLSRLPEVEYTDPEVIHQISFVPNDAMYSQQYALQKITAPQAWDITKGDPNIVIAIIDTGVDWTHEDLRANIWINPGEDINRDGKYTTADINKVDDDNNGYIDDIIGIDFAGKNSSNSGSYYDNEPSPTSTGNPHGTHVAGIAAAVGNNGIGISGVAFSCKILAVKCGTDDGGSNITRGYDGIVYAANMGAKIINASWGGGGYIRSEEERIEYATSKGALVVAAAGNANSANFSSPAAYSQVLSVANVNQNDVRDGTSSFGFWVDVSAPGVSILSTVPGNRYQSAGWTGTSMSSPCAAGVAALVKSKFPNYTPLQVAEQVRVTSDNIDAKNPNYIRKLGYGRVNAFRALTITLPSVRMVKFFVSDKNTGNGNGIIDPGEKLELVLDWKNFLAPTTNALVNLSTKNSFVTVLNSNFTIGQLNMDQTISNASAPFIVEIKPNVPNNTEISFEFTIVDGSYQDYGGFNIFAKPTYRDHDANDITVTLSNDGNLGFDDFSNLRGKGFIYQDNGFNVLFEGSLMLGGKINGVARVVDQARDESGSVQKSDFVGDNSVVMVTPGKVAAQEGFASWTDNTASGADKLGVLVNLHSYEFTQPDSRNIVILRYTCKNTSLNTITDFHAGLFFDWDISKSAKDDKADFDLAKQTGFAGDISQVNGVPTHVGMTVLTRDKPIHWMAINNPDKNPPPGFGIYDGFTKDEKWLSMSSGIYQKTSYINDVSCVIGNGPYQLNPGDTCEVTFALIAGMTNDEVVRATDKALEKWIEINRADPVKVEPTIPAGLLLDQNYPNPFSAGSRGNTSTMIHYELPSLSQVKLEVLDVQGRTITTLVDERQQKGSYSISFDASKVSSGTYLYRLTYGNIQLTRKMLYVR